MRELIKDLARRATVILSTHILQEVQAICDRVIIINRAMTMRTWSEKRCGHLRIPHDDAGPAAASGARQISRLYRADRHCTGADAASATDGIAGSP
jgi:ABC-type multidrug transport system ATPase subunit